MKTRTNFTWVALVATIGIVALALISCDDNGDDTPEQFGVVNGIPVYKEAGVTSTQAQTAADNARAGYNAMLSGKDKITPAKVSKIILAETEDSCLPDTDAPGKFIIKLRANRSAEGMAGRFEEYAGDQLLL